MLQKRLWTTPEGMRSVRCPNEPGSICPNLGSSGLSSLPQPHAKPRRSAEHSGVCFLTRPRPSKMSQARIHECVGPRVTSPPHGLISLLHNRPIQASEVHEPVVSQAQHGSSWTWQSPEQNFNLHQLSSNSRPEHADRSCL